MNGGHAHAGGIGLAVIGHVMTLHGGSARFAPRDHGARLELRLPPATPSSTYGDMPQRTIRSS